MSDPFVSTALEELRYAPMTDEEVDYASSLLHVIRNGVPFAGVNRVTRVTFPALTSYTTSFTLPESMLNYPTADQPLGRDDLLTGLWDSPPNFLPPGNLSEAESRVLNYFKYMHLCLPISVGDMNYLPYWFRLVRGVPDNCQNFGATALTYIRDVVKDLYFESLEHYNWCETNAKFPRDDLADFHRDIVGVKSTLRQLNDMLCQFV